MQLAFSTLPCDGWSAEKMIHACTDNGFDGIEIREGPDAPLSLGLDMEEVKNIGAQFYDAGVAVTDIGSGICLKGLPDEWPKLEEAIHPYLEFAAALKARGIRIFIGNFCSRRNDPRVQLDYGGIVESIRLFCDLSAAAGLEIWIETHNEFATGKSLHKLLSDIEKENCKVIWDIIHPMEDGELPEETLKWLGDRCAHVHIKDGIVSADPLAHDWTYTKLGEGALPVKRIVDLLTQTGYSGFYSLEWESKWRKELQRADCKPETVIPEYARFMRALAGK